MSAGSNRTAEPNRWDAICPDAANSYTLRALMCSFSATCAAVRRSFTARAPGTADLHWLRSRQSKMK
jgi:hypothetical protein